MGESDCFEQLDARGKRRYDEKLEILGSGGERGGAGGSRAPPPIMGYSSLKSYMGTDDIAAYLRITTSIL